MRFGEVARDESKGGTDDTCEDGCDKRRRLHVDAASKGETDGDGEGAEEQRRARGKDDDQSRGGEIRTREPLRPKRSALTRLSYAPPCADYICRFARVVQPRPAYGYAMVAVAATLFAVNGTVSKVVLGSGISSGELTEVRCAGAFIGLALIAALTRPESLRIARRELRLIVPLGVGLAIVQWSYFYAIHRLAIGIALLIQYVAPILVALWARFVYHEQIRRRIWIALALSLAGLTLIVEIWHGGRLSGAGVAACIVAAITYAAYVLMAERGVRRRDPISLLAWGFFFATLFWTAVAPWWTFPGGRIDDRVSLLGHLSSRELPVWILFLWVIVLGAIVPFALIVASLRHISATRAGITAMLEPVVAIAVAWVWLGETLAPVQLSGALLTLVGIALAQTAR
jgi:drug/metabolite transporter (DMT)-like permease